MPTGAPGSNTRIISTHILTNIPTTRATTITPPTLPTPAPTPTPPANPAPPAPPAPPAAVAALHC